ncbi:MAG: hypothetical protein SFZ23_03675 [Planctomycetota bacterium]|nr:hypothetical protein [Planctomycetota bacterium]
MSFLLTGRTQLLIYIKLSSGMCDFILFQQDDITASAGWQRMPVVRVYRARATRATATLVPEPRFQSTPR